MRVDPSSYPSAWRFEPVFGQIASISDFFLYFPFLIALNLGSPFLFDEILGILSYLNPTYLGIPYFKQDEITTLPILNNYLN